MQFLCSDFSLLQYLFFKDFPLKSVNTIENHQIRNCLKDFAYYIDIFLINVFFFVQRPTAIFYEDIKYKYLQFCLKYRNNNDRSEFFHSLSLAKNKNKMKFYTLCSCCFLLSSQIFIKMLLPKLFSQWHSNLHIVICHTISTNYMNSCKHQISYHSNTKIAMKKSK